MIHVIDMIDMRQTQELVTFLGQILPRMQWLRMIHIAHDTYDRHDRHETETRAGHIFGANFATHAVVTYNTYCTGYAFLQGIIENAGAQTLLKQFKSCSQKPFSQKCLKSGGFSTNPQERAGGDFDNFVLKNHWVFDVFMLKSLRNLRFWKDFVSCAPMCTSSYFLQGIIEI